MGGGNVGVGIGVAIGVGVGVGDSQFHVDLNQVNSCHLIIIMKSLKELFL